METERKNEPGWGEFNAKYEARFPLCNHDRLNRETLGYSRSTVLILIQPHKSHRYAGILSGLPTRVFPTFLPITPVTECIRSYLLTRSEKKKRRVRKNGKTRVRFSCKQLREGEKKRSDSKINTRQRRAEREGKANFVSDRNCEYGIKLRALSNN